VRKEIWREKTLEDGKDEPMPEDFWPTCRHWETKEALTAQQVLELRGFSTNVDNLQMKHDIELHELYEIPTESKGWTTQQIEKWLE